MPPKQVINVPLAAGLDTKSDPRALDVPMLSICKDAEFDSIGGLVTRKPYTNQGLNALGGGTVSNPRRLFASDNELLLFSDTGLYSWDARDSVWALRSPHLAATAQETTVFQTQDDQIDTDRAELGNSILYAWSNGTDAYVGARDKTTGATIVAPTKLTGGTRPRLVACTTRIILFYVTAGGGLLALPIDPANIATSLAGGTTTVLAAANFNSYYDVVQIPGADQVVGGCRRQTTTSHTLFTLTSGMSLVTSTKARTCDGPIAVAATPDGIKVQVGRGNGTLLVTDVITLSGLVDTSALNVTVTTISGSFNQITAVHSPTNMVFSAGVYECSFVWSATENATGLTTTTGTNWILTDGTGNTNSIMTIFPHAGVASRAFVCGTNRFVWLAFGQTSTVGAGGANTSPTGAFQNSYFLVRITGPAVVNGSNGITAYCPIVAKAVCERGGGLCPSTGRLPGVAITSGSTTTSVCLTVRRRVPVGTGTGSGSSGVGAVVMRAVGRGAVSSVAGLAIGGSGNVAVQPMPTASSLRTPQDVSVTIDDNAGRRAVRLGPTVYMPGGEISQYDGGAIVEVGFHVYPFYLDTTTTGGGSVANGLYAYKETYKWTNLQGDIDRSTTAIVLNSTMSGGPQSFSVVMVTTSFTKKSADYSAQYGSPFGTRSVTNITEELWRTLVNPLADSPFYLVTSQTPGTANPNKYQENVASAGANVGSQVVDGEADTTVGANQSNPENSLVLPNLAPPAASIIAATDLRIFLAGIAGDPDTVWYSKQRNTGEVAAFSDALTFSVPKAGGKITALSFLNETLVVFRERAIYAFAGDGFDNLGRGNNYGPARIVSLEVGAVNAESVALIAAGLMFKSSRGWFVLNRGWGIDYVGQGAAAYDSEVPVSVQVVGGQQQVRIATANRVLIYDTLQKLWGEWSISGVLDAVVWNGTYVYLTSAGVFQQAADFSGGTNYGMDVELAWLKPAGFTGRFDVRNIMPLGEFRSAFNLRLRVARNNLQDGSGNSAYFDDRIKTPETTVGSRMQVRHGPSIQSGFESIKVRLTATGTLATLAITSGGATVTFTSKRAGTLGNALSLAHTLTSQAVPSVADSGGNTITLSGLATLTFQQVVDATNLGSQLVSAALTAGSGATSFALTAFTGSPTGGVDWPTGEAMRLTAVGFEVQGGEGMFGLLPQAQTG